MKLKKKYNKRGEEFNPNPQLTHSWNFEIPKQEATRKRAISGRYYQRSYGSYPIKI